MEIVIQKHGDKITAYDDRTAKTYSIEELQNLAANGDSEAQNAMGSYFFELKNIDEAMAWYKKAAENGNADAQWKLGGSYFAGAFGVKKDLEKAESWLRKSAEQGHAGGQCGLGGCYFAKNDWVNAKHWLEKSVAQGPANKNYAEAKHMLEAVMMFLKADYKP